MSPRPLLFHSARYQDYRLSPTHPMQPIRVERARELIELMGIPVDVREPKLATREELLLAHSEDYLDVVLAASSHQLTRSLTSQFGLGTGDTPTFENMYDASSAYAGGTVSAAGSIVQGETQYAINLAGGLHHAHYASAAGFCVINDCVMGLRILRQRYARVAYVDIDVHHGDGVQEAFYDDPTVLTISIHQSGRTLFPGTGQVEEIGHGAGMGYSINLPVWPEADDAIWLRTWKEGALPVLRAFQPEAILLQMGTDAHYLDPLANINLTAQGWLESVRDVIALGVPIVAVGGGGYEPTAVPRMWTLAVGALAGIEPNDVVPASFSWYKHIQLLRDPQPPRIHQSLLDHANRFADATIAEFMRRINPYFDLSR